MGMIGIEPMPGVFSFDLETPILPTILHSQAGVKEFESLAHSFEGCRIVRAMLHAQRTRWDLNPLLLLRTEKDYPAILRVHMF